MHHQNGNPKADLDTVMTHVDRMLTAFTATYSNPDRNSLLDTAPGTHRDDMAPMQALAEMYDLWSGGGLDPMESEAHIQEVQHHVNRFKKGRP